MPSWDFVPPPSSNSNITKLTVRKNSRAATLHEFDIWNKLMPVRKSTRLVDIDLVDARAQGSLEVVGQITVDRFDFSSQRKHLTLGLVMPVYPTTLAHVPMPVAEEYLFRIGEGLL